MLEKYLMIFIFIFIFILLIFLKNESKENFISNSKIYQNYKSKLRKHHRNVTRGFNFHMKDIVTKSKRFLRKRNI